MKLFILSFVMLIASSAFAADPNIDDIASNGLATLMSVNPIATSRDGGRRPVTDLIASMFTSNFDRHGVGNLSVSTNSCVRVRSGNYHCTLNIANSDRVIDANGAYAEAPAMTESALTIDYTIDFDGKTLHATSVEYMFAD